MTLILPAINIGSAILSCYYIGKNIASLHSTSNGIIQFLEQDTGTFNAEDIQKTKQSLESIKLLTYALSLLSFATSIVGIHSSINSCTGLLNCALNESHHKSFIISNIMSAVISFFSIQVHSNASPANHLLS
jgi:hypothetical protein